VVGWSKFDNVVMKLSGMPEKEKYPHRDPAAVVKQLGDAFGAERERTATMLAGFSETDRSPDSKRIRKELRPLSLSLAPLWSQQPASSA